MLYVIWKFKRIVVICGKHLRGSNAKLLAQRMPAPVNVASFSAQNETLSVQSSPKK